MLGYPCAKIVRLKMTVRKSLPGSERYLKAKKESEDLFKTIEGRNHNEEKVPPRK